MYGSDGCLVRAGTLRVILVIGDSSSVVDFVFVGPDKSGSTWLDAQLRSHPDVVLPIAKELFFFDRYHNRGLDWYRSQFPAAGRHLVRAELSHDYMFDPVALDRLKDSAPNVKVMCCLRDPFERAYSAYRFMQYQGRVHNDASFERAIESTPELLEHGLYGKHLSSLYERFRAEQVLVNLFDGLSADPQGFLDSVCDFAEIKRVTLPERSRAPVLASRRARNQRLNSALRTIGWLLRDAGFGSMVARIKRSAVISVLSTQDGGAAPPDFDRLRAQAPRSMLDDLAIAETLTGRQLREIWGYPMT